MLLPSLVLAIGAPLASAKIVGSAFLPHGDFAFDPSLVSFENGSQALHDAGVVVGSHIVDLAPDIILISTPHGESEDVNFLFLDATRAHAKATIGLDLDQDCGDGCYTATLPVDHVKIAKNVTLETVEVLRSRGFRVASLSAFADTEPAPLRWGELIPLSFLNQTLNRTELVVMGQPTRRYTEEVAMVPELLSLGGAIFDMYDRMDARVVVLISGDLAHTHLASGPYGYSAAASPFDAAMGAWAEGLQDAPLLDDATDLSDAAKSCGFTGAVMLHGLLNASASEGKRVHPRLLARAAPTYYGMMVAEFAATTA